MEKLIYKKKLIKLLSWYNKYNKYNLLLKKKNNIFFSNIFILFTKWQFQYKIINPSFNINLYWKNLNNLLTYNKLFKSKFDYIIKFNYINNIKLFIRKYIKREFFKFSTKITSVYIKKNIKKKHKLDIVKENNFYLKIFFFEKSSIFQNFISKKKSKKFSVKVYKDFYLYNKNLRIFYYITKGYYKFLLKKKYNLHYSSNLFFNVRKTNINNFFYFLLLKDKSFNINYNNLSDNLFWKTYKQLHKFNEVFFYNSEMIEYMIKNNIFNRYTLQYKDVFFINNFYKNYFLIKIYSNLNNNFYKNYLYKLNFKANKKKLPNYKQNQKSFKKKKIKSNPLFFKLYNLIYYGKTYGITHDRLYYTRYNLVYEKIIKLFYSIKYNKNYKLLYKKLYNILFYDFKYHKKYQKIYYIFHKTYNKFINKNFYLKSKKLNFLYKTFNKIFNKIFYFLCIIFRKIYYNNKSLVNSSKKIFKFIKIYHKLIKNYRYYKYYKNLIKIIKIKYKSKYILGYLKSYKNKLIYFKNKLFNKIFLNNLLSKTFKYNKKNLKYNKKNLKYNRKLIISKNNWLKYNTSNNNFLKALVYSKKNIIGMSSNLDYYKFFFKNSNNKKNKKIFLFNLKSPFILSSYRIYNIKFFYPPIKFSPKLINKNFIQAIKRFINVYIINLSNLFFNQYYINLKNLKKNYIIKFVTMFIIKFNNNFRKNFSKNFSKKFINMFITRFNKFLIKTFSESYTKKKSDYLNLEGYIDNTIGNFEINIFKDFNHFTKNFSSNIYYVFLKRFNNKFRKFFKIEKLKKLNISKVKNNNKKIIWTSYYKRILYFFYNKLYYLYFYWYIYISNNYLYLMNNIFYSIWLSSFQLVNNISLYFLELYFRNISYIDYKTYINYSNYSLYKWFLIGNCDSYTYINNFLYKKSNFNWFFISKKIYMYRNFLNIFDDIKRSYKIKMRKNRVRLSMCYLFIFTKIKVITIKMVNA